MTKEGVKQEIPVRDSLFGITQKIEVTVPFEKLKNLNLTLKSIEFDGEHFFLRVEKPETPQQKGTVIKETETGYVFLYQSGQRSSVSKKYVSLVFETLNRLGEATVKQLETETKIYKDGVRRALAVLMHQEKVWSRRKGRTKIYCVSPILKKKYVAPRKTEVPSVEINKFQDFEGLKYAREMRLKAMRED